MPRKMFKAIACSALALAITGCAAASTIQAPDARSTCIYSNGAWNDDRCVCSGLTCDEGISCNTVTLQCANAPIEANITSTADNASTSDNTTSAENDMTSCTDACASYLDEKDEEIAMLRDEMRIIQLDCDASQSQMHTANKDGAEDPSESPSSRTASKSPAGSDIAASDIKNALKNASQLASKCSKSGTLNIALYLNPNGKASDVKAVGGSLKDTPAEKCILKVFEGYNYPTFNRGTVPVKYTVRM